MKVYVRVISPLGTSSYLISLPLFPSLFHLLGIQSLAVSKIESLQYFQSYSRPD